ncbi:MAG: serine protease [Polyangiaceae bacterium]
MRIFALLLSATTLLAAGAADAKPLAKQRSTDSVNGAALFARVRLEARVNAASAFLPDRACTGVLVGSPRVVATAAHCVAGRTAAVELSDGTKTHARVAHLDEDQDVALLVLDVASSVKPLGLSARMPKQGESLLFLGRPDRASPRDTAVEKLAPCPSLPKLRRAAFTDLLAVPGDSGAPLVDAQGNVVALVHSGARCHIAVPARPLFAAFQRLPQAVRNAPLAAPPPVDPTAPSPVVPPSDSALPEEPAQVDTDASKRDARNGESKRDARGKAAPQVSGERQQFGPIVFERTDKGFKFRFSFSFGTK